MKEAAKMIGVATSTFCEKYEEWGLIPVELPGRAYNKRWLKSELQAFITSLVTRRDSDIKAAQEKQEKILKLVRTRRRA